MAALSTPTTPYRELVAPFMLSGIGMAMFWAPVANVVEPAQRTVAEKGQEFAERLRAAIPRQFPRGRGHL